MVVSMFVLILFINGEIKEFMGHHENNKGQWVEMGMSGCLGMKRTLKRNGWRDSSSGKTRFVCEKHKVLVKDNHKGLPTVVKIVD